MTWTRPIAIVLITSLLLWGPTAYPALAQSPPPAQEDSGEGVAAGFSNVLYIPGKAIFCASSGVLWLTMMVFTLGHSYNAAANFVKGGCGGKWIVRGEDIKLEPSQ